MTDIGLIISSFSHPGVKVVSFDIFDTLLERPALRPDDIFVLLNDDVKKLLRNERFNFHRARGTIEREAVARHSRGSEEQYTLTYRQIYDCFKARYSLTQAQTLAIMDLELDLENQLLSARPEGRRLYDAAVAAGRKIICVSDMYHDSGWLANILAQRGFGEIAGIYVSSEVKKRKDSGALFKHVLDAERLDPHQLIHVGDNRRSDFEIPVGIGIPAFHLPASREKFFTSVASGRDLWAREYSPSEGLAIGFCVNRWSQRPVSDTALFGEQRDIGYFGLGPVLFAIAQYLRSNRVVQSRYPVIHFASRDGYLPMKAYEYLAENATGPSIPARYLYCGRSLYSAAHYQGRPLSYLIERTRKALSAPGMTLGALFDSLIEPGFPCPDDPRRETLLGDDMAANYAVLKSVVEERADDLDRLLTQKRENIRAYYHDSIAFSGDGRALIFDCGYSGSVSEDIMRLTGRKIDKVYVCKTMANTFKDRLRGTRTHLLYCDLRVLKSTGIVNIFEEIFSALDDQCIDIRRHNGVFQPVFDHSQPLSETTRRDVALLQHSAMQFIKDIKQAFGPYLGHFPVDTIAFAAEPLLAALGSAVDMSVRHFENIFFPDSYFGDNRSLAEKTEPSERDHLLRTPFVVRKNIVSAPALEPFSGGSLKIAIHLHLYHADMAPCFATMLAALPVPFDLYISVSSARDEALAQVVFGRLFEARSHRLVIRAFPNRGRDVGAWVVGFGASLSAYDLAAHLHTKKSVHFPWGDAWREYLLDNLITPEAFGDIRQLFAANPRAGLVFPPIYREVFELWGRHDLSPMEATDRRNCLQLMERMGINAPLSKHTLLFSVGNMFWYRPAALAPLMDLGLTFDDFPEEPTPITGTLAHAIERLPSIVARHCGYVTSCYLRQNHLINMYAEARMPSLAAGVAAGSSVARTERTMATLMGIGLRFLPPGTRRYRLARAAALKIMPVAQNRKSC